MKPPPDALGRVESAKATAEAATQRARAWRRKAKRAAARAYLAQCRECGATGTVRLRTDGQLVSLGLPMHGRRHAGCGGGFSLFDLPTKDSDAA